MPLCNSCDDLGYQKIGNLVKTENGGVGKILAGPFFYKDTAAKHIIGNSKGFIAADHGPEGELVYYACEEVE